jgi:hypothetical protein
LRGTSWSEGAKEKEQEENAENISGKNLWISHGEGIDAA